MSVRELQRRADEAQAELEKAERTLAEVMEGARRKGIPPGWLG